MQQGGGGGPQSSGVYAAELVISTDEHQKLGDLGIAEAASPISSRPPAAAIGTNTNFEELMRSTAEAGGGSGNRWPRQETLALLQIRSEMDAVFRDATLKGPLWEQVSRKLGELGYKRSAKKCKEKFENVHKYYKRTKEGRGGRQDGKSYKFFDQLEALQHHTSTPDNNLLQTLPTIANPSTSSAAPLPAPPPPPPPQSSSLPPFGTVGISFSSSESSSSSEGEDDEEMETGQLPGDRKRKRGGGDGGRSDDRMMEFFEGLLKQVMQKQEAMQNKFLEAIEKREQDRMIREEAWKRQDLARLAREHELMAQEHAICASRDAAIVAFLEKITGQTIHLPATTTPQNPPPPPAEPQVPHQRQFIFNQQQKQHQHVHRDPIGANVSSQPSIEKVEAHPNPKSDQNQIVAAIPEQQIPLQEYTGLENMASSSRWPKAEVLALIQIRSGLEPKYQENGPKGPLWEEISAAMQRIGYNRSAKRCKEKWENINKYFKKVKESNKKRPQDAKTCPYFHELDELYRKKILPGNTSANVIGGGGGSTEQERHQQQQQQEDVGMVSLQASSAEAFPPALLVEQSQHNTDGSKQPEGMLKKQHQQGRGDMMILDNGCNNIIDRDHHDLDLDENYNDSYEEVDENEEYDDKTEEEMKMVYKIQFQTPNVGGSSNGGGNTTSASFMAMVQ